MTVSVLKAYWSQPATAVVAALDSAAGGLTEAEARRRLREFGPNRLRDAKGSGALSALVKQFASPLVLILLFAAIVSLAIGEWLDASIILAIVAGSGLLGFAQEYSASRAVQKLRQQVSLKARALRDGTPVEIPAEAVVPGDVVMLAAGSLIPADGLILAARDCFVIQAALTGETFPAEKMPGVVAPDASLPERTNCAFMGTSVRSGTAQLLVVETGTRTQFGNIAHRLNLRPPETEFERGIRRFGYLLTQVMLVLVVVAFAINVLFERPVLEALLFSIALAVGLSPELLPAVITVTLGRGARAMAAKGVIVRRLNAIENLGSMDVFCTDKTGTLTTGVMTVRELWGPDHRQLLDAAAANCEAELVADGRGGIGDPTEIAILAAAAQRGIHRAMIEQARPRMAVNPFDAERKRMSIQRADGVLYVKGAFDGLLPLCRTIPDGIHEAHEDMAGRGLRVLAVAVGPGPEEQDLALLGLIGIADPPRTEAIAAVAAAQRAGIRTVMITGDHAVTARAIAQELGIVRPGEAAEAYVHARATPEDKLKIVRAWKAGGAIVAMTGDGVNDAPALREAHIGIAMGRGGTEVTREAADMVLTDDNFASIVAAVEEGRGIYDNIRKALVYLLAGNAGELMVMFVAALVGLPLPLLPLHLLWINLVTDGLPALTLVMDPVDRDALQRPPRRPDEPLLGRSQWMTIMATGVLQAAVTLGVFVWALQMRDLVEARNLAFSTLVFGELFRAFAARSPTRLFFEVGVFTNLRLLGVVSLSTLVQIALHHIPATQDIFQIGALSLADCGLTLLLGLLPVTVLELAKIVRRRLIVSGVLHNTLEG
jgi:Ca2+-transporting ATPase